MEDDDAVEEEEQTIKPQERERRQIRSTVVDRAREQERTQAPKEPMGKMAARPKWSMSEMSELATGQLEQVRGQRERERGRASEDKGKRANSLDNTPQVVVVGKEAIHYTAGILEVRRESGRTRWWCTCVQWTAAAAVVRFTDKENREQGSKSWCTN